MRLLAFQCVLMRVIDTDQFMRAYAVGGGTLLPENFLNRCN
jgi:hypothetical protein